MDKKLLTVHAAKEVEEVPEVSADYGKSWLPATASSEGLG
jgi:hypothetical protein